MFPEFPTIHMPEIAYVWEKNTAGYQKKYGL